MNAPTCCSGIWLFRPVSCQQPAWESCCSWPLTENMLAQESEEMSDFDVEFDVHVPPHQVTTNHTNRGSGAQGTVPDDMGHDGTVLWAQNYETAALPLSYAGFGISLGNCCKHIANQFCQQAPGWGKVSLTHVPWLHYNREGSCQQTTTASSAGGKR